MSAPTTMSSTVNFYISCCSKMGCSPLPSFLTFLQTPPPSPPTPSSFNDSTSLRLQHSTDSEIESVMATIAMLKGEKRIRLEVFEGKFGTRGLSALASTIEVRFMCKRGF